MDLRAPLWLGREGATRLRICVSLHLSAQSGNFSKYFDSVAESIRPVVGYCKRIR